MLYLHQPSPDAIAAFLESQARLGLTYSAVGATAGVPPAHGYKVDHTRTVVGTGPAAFLAARQALERWDHFRLGWVEARCPSGLIRPDATVAIVAQSLGFCWVNACRIIYVVDEDGSVKRFGFACGTLPAHAGSGEERFLVEWDRSDDRVYYDILAFSRPHGFLANLGYPWFRLVQKRFRRDSTAAMLKAVGNGPAERGEVS